MVQTKGVQYHKRFRKHFAKRISGDSKLEKKVKERLSLFLTERSNPLLCDHKLKGEMRSYRAFSITGDIRIVYEETADVFILLDIGTHTQVYDM